MRAVHAMIAAASAALLVLGVSAAQVPAAAATTSVPTAAAGAPSVDRLWGLSRYDTAVAVSKAGFPTGARVVVVATGATYADALSAGPAAAAWGGPLLLSDSQQLLPSVAEELRRLKPARVVLVGGTGALSARVAAQVEKIVPDTVRYGGANRYETSIALVRAAFPDGASEALVATGDNYPDALSGGALAARRSAPMLIVSDRAPVTQEMLTAELTRLGAAKVTILGGTGVVSTALQKKVAATIPQVSRIDGADRYVVSQRIAAQFEKGTGALVASGTNYPDALSATALAAVRQQPVLLSRPVCADDGFIAHVKNRAVNRITLVGGPGAVRGLVGSLTRCLSLSAPSSPWVLVNKKRPLNPRTYAPKDLRRVKLTGSGSLRGETATQLEKLAAGMSAAGAGKICVTSGYRSYSTQRSVYSQHVRTRGLAWAEKASARPGHSEHQTGMAVDVSALGRSCGSIYSFGASSQGRWVAANAHKYGFIVRYQSGRTGITGYMAEPWHLRYVGTTLAADYHAGGFTTLEQYLDAPAAPNY